MSCPHEVTRQICECRWFDVRCHECPTHHPHPPLCLIEEWVAASKEIEEAEAAIERGDLGEPVSVNELRRRVGVDGGDERGE